MQFRFILYGNILICILISHAELRHIYHDLFMTLCLSAGGCNHKKNSVK